jgi:hypothetical protein
MADNTGRPSSYSEDMADRICELIADGESLRSICKAEDMPAKSTVFKWLRDVPGFSDQYARARETQADAIFDEIIDISDDASNDWMERHDSEGKSIGWQLNGDHVRRSQLRIDARKWMAGKIRPKVYGEKITQTLTGENGGPIQITPVINFNANKG